MSPRTFARCATFRCVSSESAPQGPHRDSRRSLLAVRPLRGDERGARARRRAGVRESAQLRGGKPAAARPGDNGVAAAAVLRLLRRRCPTGRSFRSRRSRSCSMRSSNGEFRSRRIVQRAKTLAEVDDVGARRGAQDPRRAQLRDRRRRRESRFAALQDELGVVGGREPRWAIARKFAPDIAETQAADDQGERRANRRAESVRGARAGRDRRSDREARDAAQRGSDHRARICAWATWCR